VREACDVLDQVEECRLGRVQVVEDSDERPLMCQLFQEPPHGPEDLLRARPALLRSHGLGNACRDQIAVVVAREELAEARARVGACDLLHDLDEGPVRDPLAVGQAPAYDAARPLAYRGEQLTRKPRLPDARRAENRDELYSTTRSPLERLLDQLKLALSAHKGRVEPTRECRYVVDFEQPPRFNRFSPALERQWRKRLEPDGVVDEPVRERAEHDLAWRCRLLETGGHVDDITCRVELAALRIANHCLAGVDARSHRECDATLTLQCSAEHSEALTHLRGCLDRA